MATSTITWDYNATVELPSSFYSSRSHAVIAGSILIIIGTVGIFGNLMVFMAVFLSKTLQDTTHVFVVSLAISDFLTALALPFEGISVLTGNGWPFGNVLCKLSGALVILALPTSILTLAAIAVNRYIIITKSKIWRQKIYTRRNVAISVALQWLLPLLVLVLPHFIPATGDIMYNPGPRFCSWDLEHPKLLMFRLITAIGAICCSAVIVFCYVAIIVHVWRHTKAARQRVNISSESITIDSQETSTAGPNKVQIDITKNLAIVVVAFFICLLPYSLNLYSYQPKTHTIYLYLLLNLSTCLNPIIYAVKHPRFKAVFKCMLYCRFHDVPLPSEWLKNVLRKRNGVYE